MAWGTLTFIIGAELIVLLRLILPDMLRFFEARHDAVYGQPHGDWPQLPTIDVRTFHESANITEAK